MSKIEIARSLLKGAEERAKWTKHMVDQAQMAHAVSVANVTKRERELKAVLEAEMNK